MKLYVETSGPVVLMRNACFHTHIYDTPISLEALYDICILCMVDICLFVVGVRLPFSKYGAGVKLYFWRQGEFREYVILFAFYHVLLFFIYSFVFII